MVIFRALSLVPQCYNWADGDVIFHAIDDSLSRGKDVTVSFEGVDSLPSSFVNAALIPLLAKYSFKDIKSRLHFTHTNSQINDIIRKRFAFETASYPPLPKKRTLQHA